MGLVANLSQAQTIVKPDNPDPARLPTLEVSHRVEWNQDFYYLSADFPNVPGLICDLWCFESEGLEFAQAEALNGGGVRMRHTWKDHDWEVVTVATPEAGALDVLATLEATGAKKHKIPKEYPGLNVCWQLRRAPNFWSKNQPYPEFVKRCFIFTENGRTFLDQTVRRKIPVRSPDDKYNNPPWVQMYLSRSSPEIKAATNSWADYSPDRFTVPVVGAVSRDGKYQTALVSGSAGTMCQAWHDCMHNNPLWMPGKNGTAKEWRIRIYAMENDSEALLDRVKKDFPGMIGD